MTSFFSRMSTEMGNALQDAYSNFMYGDDAGKSARLVYMAQPRSRDDNGRVHLDMTFISINNRAYVSTVEQESMAADMGVRMQDALQFAAVLTPSDESIPGSVLKSEAVAKDWALDMERKGCRTNYQELRKLMKEVGEGNAGRHFYPIIMVFRRTRKRTGNKFSGGGPPMGLPSFRLDEECDRAASLIRKLAPNSSDEEEEPSAWDELYHDTKELFFGSASGKKHDDMSKRKQSSHLRRMNSESFDEHSSVNLSIPQDTFESENNAKAARLKENMRKSRKDKVDDVEASAIRELIEGAVGLAFIRVSKVVIGVSIHGGTGIVIARLSDGTWSAPSAIGSIGGGLGLQFGVEVADFLLILQTEDALAHFKRGGNFTVGGNLGCAIAGIGREAFGAASFKGSCIPTTADLDGETLDVDNSSEVAPIVAYARSQGIYFGVSLEGSKLFTRTDINERSYKFLTGSNVLASDILSGKVDTPPEAENLYAALHSLEFNHKLKSLPKPPKVLLKNTRNEWVFNPSNNASTKAIHPESVSLSFLSSINDDDAEELAAFETKFKKFMYGGVSVQRLVTDGNLVNSMTRRERRTLWLMLPDVGSLRLGYLSKIDDAIGGSPSHSARRYQGNRRTYDDDDEDTYCSEGASTYVTDDSGLYTGYTDDYTHDDYTFDGTADESMVSRQKNVRLSIKHSIPLTSIIRLSQDPNVSVHFNPDDATEHLRVINIDDGNGTTLLFLANNVQEAELLICGLKLLLERETSRLGVRGGVPTNKISIDQHNIHNNSKGNMKEPRDESSDDSSSSGDIQSNVSKPRVPNETKIEQKRPLGVLKQSSIVTSQARYELGKDVTETIVANVSLPLPFALCRVLLLDSSSPAIIQWEVNRGDKHFEKGKWTFPLGTRENETYSAEYQLLSKGSIAGAHRTISFDRRRNGTYIRLSETHVVDSDNADNVSLNIVERLPRRGFAVKVRVHLKLKSPHSCEVAVRTEIRPVGKKLSNQDAVHKAYGMVVDEMNTRYGIGPRGLINCLIQLIKSLPSSGSVCTSNSTSNPPRSNTSPARNLPPVDGNRSKDQQSAPASSSVANEASGFVANNNGLPSLQDVISAKRAAAAAIKVNDDDISKRQSPTRNSSMNIPQTPPRPSTPSFKSSILPSQNDATLRNKHLLSSNTFSKNDENDDDHIIEVKPLPKIRLSLMPSPREVDEDSSSQEGRSPSRNTGRTTRVVNDITSTRRVMEWPDDSKTFIKRGFK